ncbi:MAG: hypothetical protein WCD70_03205, partial [Alphaproteobacteria bacterium]
MRMHRVNIGQRVDPKQHTPTLTSYHALRKLLTDPTKNLEWLEPSVLYLAADEYDVGIFVIQVYPERGTNATHYYHIRPASAHHIAVWFANGHYQCVGYGRQRVFPTQHELIHRLQQLCITHAPPIQPEADLDVEIIAAASTRAADDSAAPPVQPSPTSLTDAAPEQRRSRRESLPRRVTDSKPASAPHPSPSRTSSAPASAPIAGRRGQRQKNNKQASRTYTPSILPKADAPLTAADLAAHGELYDYISFTNAPQWVAICTLVLNAYRVASQSGDRAAQQHAVEDLLMLPQRVLTRTSRGGDPRRLTSTIRARCKGMELRMRYRSMPPRDDNIELTVSTAALMHRTEAAVPDSSAALTAASSTASTVVLRPAEDDVVNSTSEPQQVQEDEEDEEDADDDDCIRSFIRATAPASD